MRSKILRIALLHLLIGALVAADAAAQSPVPPDFRRNTVDFLNGIPVIGGRAVVRFSGKLPDDSSWIDADLLKNLPALREVRRFPGQNVVVVETDSRSTETLIAELQKMSRFRYVEPDFIVKETSSTPKDGYFQNDDLWGLKKINAPAAWRCSVGSRSVIVAVVDGGFDTCHFELSANRWEAPEPLTMTINGSPITCGRGTFGYDAVDKDCDPPTSLHGTHVAATIGAASDEKPRSMVGVNWKVSLMSVRFLQDGQSQGATDAVAALTFVLNAKKAEKPVDVRVVTLSWGTEGDSETLHEILRLLAASGIVIVAGAGNNGNDNKKHPFYPANYSDVPTLISVAASTRDDTLWSGSNYGTNVDLAAPGVDILSATVHPYHDVDTGTSMAAAFVSGAAALLAAACPGITAAEIKERLVNNTDPLTPTNDKPMPNGRLNVEKALKGCSCTDRATPEAVSLRTRTIGLF